MQTSNYWVVNVPETSTLDDILESGIWYCAKSEVNEAQFSEIKTGDRIAMKRMLDGGFQRGENEFLALGIVKADADLQAWRVYVDWLRIGCNADKKFSRIITGHRFPNDIHGAYQYENKGDAECDVWIREIFCI